MSVTIENLVTSGTFSLDGGTWDVDNNVWIIGDDAECVVIDAPHDASAIIAAIGPRRLTAILCTHAHDDHVDAAAALADATNAPIWLHPADRELWQLTYPDRAPDGDLADGQKISVAGAELEVGGDEQRERGCVLQCVGRPRHLRRGAGADDHAANRVDRHPVVRGDCRLRVGRRVGRDPAHDQLRGLRAKRHRRNDGVGPRSRQASGHGVARGGDGLGTRGARRVGLDRRGDGGRRGVRRAGEPERPGGSDA
jgi:hypothetical protein